MTQGAADLASIPLVEAKGESDVRNPRGRDALHRLRQGDAGRGGLGRARLGAADRERRLPGRAGERPGPAARAAPGGRRALGSAAKPVLEINPRHELIVALANLGEDEQTLREDAAHLLLDEARILDGELPADAKASRSGWRG